MAVEDIHVQLTRDGKTDVLENYILIKPKGADMDLFTNCIATDYLVGMMMLHNAFIEEAQRLSDQDLYTMCEAIGFDFQEVRQMVREGNSWTE